MIEKILAFIYRKENDGFKFLALRNNPDDPKHGGDFWFVVTGAIEKDENITEAVKREVDEETGIKGIKEIKNLNKNNIYKDFMGRECIEHEFLVCVNSEVEHLNEEHVEYKWLAKDEFINLIDWKDKNDLEEILKQV